MTEPAGIARANAYDAWYQTGLGQAAHRIEQGDAGCGTGRYTRWLTDQGLHVTELDRDPAMLAACHERAPCARLVEGDITALPLPDRDYELAIAVTVLCFLDPIQRQAAARELLRIARPGGRVVIAELAHTSLWALQRHIKGWRGSATWPHAHFTTARELRQLLTDAGAATRYGLYLPPWNQPLLTRRSRGTHHPSARSARPSSPLSPIDRIGSSPQNTAEDTPLAAPGRVELLDLRSHG